MTTPTPQPPSIPGVDREALAEAISDAWWTKVKSNTNPWHVFADAVLGHIATHQKPVTCICGAEYDRCPQCAADDAYEKGRKDAACDRDHNDDDWVEVDEGAVSGLSKGARVRVEWVSGVLGKRRFVHRDDLPDPDAKTILTALVQRVRATKEGCLAVQNFEGAMLWRDVEADLLKALRDFGWTVTQKEER